MKIKLINVLTGLHGKFEADIILNNKVIGKAFNLGDGSATQYHFESPEYENKIKDYCNLIPKEVIKISENKRVEIKFNIEKLINSLVNS